MLNRVVCTDVTIKACCISPQTVFCKNNGTFSSSTSLGLEFRIFFFFECYELMMRLFFVHGAQESISSSYLAATSHSACSFNSDQLPCILASIYALYPVEDAQGVISGVLLSILPGGPFVSFLHDNMISGRMLDRCCMCIYCVGVTTLDMVASAEGKQK
jgi:hypothetical protein